MTLSHLVSVMANSSIRLRIDTSLTNMCMSMRKQILETSQMYAQMYTYLRDVNGYERILIEIVELCQV